MKVKDLRLFLANLPSDADEQDIVFGTKELEGLYVIAGATESYFHDDDVPEGITKDFILLWNGTRP